jgi:hypothetical protein
MFMVSRPAMRAVINSVPGSLSDDSIAEPSCAPTSSTRASAERRAISVETGCRLAPVTSA